MVNPLIVNGKTKFHSKLYFDTRKSYFHLAKDPFLLLSVDSIKNQILALKSIVFDLAEQSSLEETSEKLSLFNAQLKKLSNQVYVFIPKEVESIVQISTDSAVVYYNIAMSFQKTNNFESSLEYYKKSINAVPENFTHLSENTTELSENSKELLKDIYYNRAFIWIELNQITNACNDLYQGELLGDPQAKEKYKVVCNP